MALLSSDNVVLEEEFDETYEPNDEGEIECLKIDF